MIENLVAEIQNIETNADGIIAGAQKKAEQLEVDAQNEIKQLANDCEKEFQQKVEELKSSIENSKNKEAAQLKSEFEKMKSKLANIDQGLLERVIESVVKEICKS